ncbi:uncharacterized protein LOC129729979 [Wyeomyia smithii]|uniref:uncharacterized protein LOC129729979 n=1 Tax=Wyeomyia smithii TaxID=174621 RepID=UPI002467E555|nr:uncharacterized protein LOC129729979 [Wyeomyia smithii]
MERLRFGVIVAVAVLIGCHSVACDSDEKETATTVGVTGMTIGSVTETITETSTEVAEPVKLSATDPIAYDDREVTNFFNSVKHQLRCGYPKFGIPSLVPLKLSYRFKTTLDFLNLKKVHVSATNFVIHGLDNFSWRAANTSFSRSRANLTVNFPNVTITANTALNGANGTSRVSLYDILVFLQARYEEKDDLLYVTDLDGNLSVKSSLVKLAHLFPKSAKLTKIWNKAIGDSVPIVVRLIATRKISAEFINRIVNGSKYYALNTANSALSSYKLNFDGVVESFKRFAEQTHDSLMCSENEVKVESRIF